MRNRNCIKGFNVYRNGHLVTFMPSRSWKSLNKYVRDAITSTHMGEWRRDLTILPEDTRKTGYAYTYNTSIGIYLTFNPAFRGDSSGSGAMRNRNCIKGFNVYRNGHLVTFMPSRSWKSLNKYVRDAITSTHMGEWRRDLTILPEDTRKTGYAYTYNTSIGIYLTFNPAFRGDSSG